MAPLKFQITYFADPENLTVRVKKSWFFA